MKYRLALVLAVLSFINFPARAQQCSVPRYTGPSISDGGYTSCTTSQIALRSIVNITLTHSYDESCVKTNTSETYAGPNHSSVTGNGQWICGIQPSPSSVCYPEMDFLTTTATSATDYNRFYNKAYDFVITSKTPAVSCAKVSGTSAFHQDVWQCPGVACPSCPSGYLWNTNTNSCVKVSPIVLDISGKGFFLTDAQDGVLFDPGIGYPVQMAWTAKGADNAFLALPGVDGLVHNGQQLFGNFTPQPPSPTPNGFAALALYDDPKNGGNADGVIDSRDAVFDSLRLWIDANHDGICQIEEIHTLSSLGVNSLSLKYKEADRTDQYGNAFRFRARVNPDDPDASRVDRKAFDIFFVTLGSPTTKNILPGLSPVGQKCAVPVPGKGVMLSAASK